MKLPRGSHLVVASHNPGKVREIKALLGPHGIEPIGAAELGREALDFRLPLGVACKNRKPTQHVMKYLI